MEVGVMIRLNHLELLSLTVHLVLLQLTSAQIWNWRTELFDWHWNALPDLVAGHKTNFSRRVKRENKKSAERRLDERTI